MEEKLVSWQTALLLKEKGFNVSCYEFYVVSTKKLYEDGDIFEKTNHNEFPDVVSAPKQSLVQKWLREIHYKLVTVDLYSDGYSPRRNYFPIIKALDSEKLGKDLFNKLNFFRYYEEALEQGILESLKLIK